MCLVGANLGCKTNLVRKHVHDEFGDRYLHTLGTKVSKKELDVSTSPEGVSVRLDLMIWDIMSHRGLMQLLKEAYFHGTQGILAVTDMTRRSTLEDLEAWIEGVESVTGQIPVVVIAANNDKRDQVQVSEEEVCRVAKALGAPCFFASGSSGEPVEAAFRHLAKAVVQSRLRDPGNLSRRVKRGSCAS